MSMVVHPLYWGNFDFPASGGKIHIEDNLGDDLPIHIHMGNQAGHPWRIRLHFTYEEFIDLCEKMKEAGPWVR